MNYDFELIFARKRKKITQAKLAEMVGVSRNTINRIEAGHRGNFELMQKVYSQVGIDYTQSKHITNATEDND